MTSLSQHQPTRPADAGGRSPRLPRPALVRAVVVAGIAVSVVHYVDNFIHWDDFVPADPADVTFSFIQRWTIPVAWVAFTACALLALRALGRGRWERVAAWLGVYSVSGLIGFGHYIDIPPSQLSGFQNTHVLLDGTLGVLLMGLALWIAAGARDVSATDARSTPARATR